MGNYDFAGLSTRSFEKLSQALAVRILGPGTIIFGDGPDGGREATYEGRANYPSAPAKQWDGYIILQAKFRQRLTDRNTDSEWAVTQLREELTKFAERKGGRRLPEYYIFITNAVLSPMQASGGKDRATAVFEEFSNTVPLRGWAVWDYDQLTTFLDTEESVRHAYTAFITPGDVLAAVMKWLQPNRPDFMEVMTSYLAQELNAAKYANLEHTSASRILLARVFVDLPIAEQRLADPPDETRQELMGFVTTLIDSARERLNPTTLLSTREASPHARYVLVGGPGQGKTTVGQFACQLFRAAILKDRPPHLMAPEITGALEDTQAVCAAETIELPKARRFPLHVILSEFATAVSRRQSAIADGQNLGDLTLFAYLVDKIRARTNRDVTNDDFRAWLGAYPWLVVLDGLDEVPSSSNRAEVLQKIEEFWIEAAQINADLLVVATTRPQDYRDDFAPRYYSHRWLVPLSPERALRYGRRLVEIRHAENADRREQLIDRLRDAASSEATARLMRTPLQITIMTTLVEQVGKPPQDRWRLFDEYYGAIYRRERERTQSELLGKHRSDIDAIHYRTGLELQIMSEGSGGTDARLSAKHFEAIVRQRLENEGHEGAALDRLSNEIVDAAAFRLVFIVGLDVDSVGFEIRSLQEFMAAEALLSGETPVVQRRLRAIAGVPSWRNVFVFAAGQCFAKAESLIDTIHAICHELNSEGSETQRAVQPGSVLALELLEDAAVAAKPKQARLLARTALQLLDAAPDEIHLRLSAVCTSAVEGVFREELEEKLKSGTLETQLGAWSVSVQLIAQNAEWAAKLAERYWPAAAEDELTIIGALPATPPSDWLFARALHCMLGVDPDRSLDDSHNDALRRIIQRTDKSVAAFLTSFPSGSRAPLRLDDAESTPFSLSYHSLKSNLLDWPSAFNVDDLHPAWRSVQIAVRAQHQCDADGVAQMLDAIADDGSVPAPLSWALPWPIAASLGDASPEAMRRVSAMLRKGELGDRAEWLAAEARWATAGVTLDELRAQQDPWSRRIELVGFPYRFAWYSIAINQAGAFAEKCAAVLERETDPSLKAALAAWLTFTAGSALQLQSTIPEIALETILAAAEAASSYVWTTVRFAAFATPHGSAKATRFLEHFGRIPSIQGSPVVAVDALMLACDILEQDPTLFGVARIIALGVSQETVADVSARLPYLTPPLAPPHLRSAVVLLMALASDRHPIDVPVVAKIIANEFPDVAGRIAELLTANADSSDLLLTALSRALPPEAWSARGAVRHALENLLTSKPGPLRDKSFWRELGFVDLHLM